MNFMIKTIPFEMAGYRLDQALAELFPEYSRSRLQTWIKQGRVSVDQEQLRCKDSVKGGEVIELHAEAEVVTTLEAEELPLDIVFEDSELLIINKPAGLVVHPAAGNWSGTLQNGLLFYAPILSTIPRSGIVHRIDKETSGLLMIAKSLTAHAHLVNQLQSRTVQREYLAITQGRMTSGGTIDEPIGRHPVNRKRQAVVESGKMAITHFRVLTRYQQHTLIGVKLETGRTHQIRVHMAHIHYPLLGDPVYGGRFRLPKDCGAELATQLQGFKRQALHAAKLGLIHPGTGAYCEWTADLPVDMDKLTKALATNDKIYGQR
ncbi:MAG: 23S rRNA pseudouridine(1911/1915/1917) synthase RluD [Methylococcaceae bacterium]|nr:23S rRNA pseudouridine(1911/1915/1917) synthase RluD [Methylococcaceae bacterium]